MRIDSTVGAGLESAFETPQSANWRCDYNNFVVQISVCSKITIFDTH